jgi:hypothetical protein
MKRRKPKLKRNSPGRPRLRYKGLAIVMRLPPDELKALDRWIKADGALLSRQQAIRRILSIALGKKHLQSVECPGLRHSNRRNYLTATHAIAARINE